VYFFDVDAEGHGFGSCWLVKKTMPFAGASEDSVWDAIHVVITNNEAQNKAKYKVTTTVFLTLNQNSDKQGAIDLAGNVTRQKEDLITIDPKQDQSNQHIRNIGRMIEVNESEIRNELRGIFINKSK
jgi:capping protein (actin filament) muscle Z-line, beta